MLLLKKCSKNIVQILSFHNNNLKTIYKSVPSMYNMNTLSKRGAFWSRKKTDYYDDEYFDDVEIKNEEERKMKEKAEKERREKEIEEMIVEYSKKYTKEEMDEINKSEEERVIIEISDKARYWLNLGKKISLYVNLPISLIGIVIIDYGFGDVTELKSKGFYYFALMIDYLFFMNSLTILIGVRNICTLATYIPDERAIEFTKLNLFGRPYKIKEKVSDLRRVSKARFTPLVSLKSNKTHRIFSTNGIGEYKDRKLYNSLIPQPVKQNKDVVKGKSFLGL
jgi:hypothetical protein